ncbi:hypothetical protein GLAREA_10481 [Glarea lozoyensis ATCC 20868]|uniref:SprT-like domain-containing protein n=1 Tax=Glarea lozoyensis (strain ATCC 20868 / MF5171) TaxID=1116229 RepID=S3DS70_GLAL2|nr:uncharacterized protein GLAREA_10481 [Glarea lozoyensis ATCC 20868]EPE34786.1 hypothetical protein GLAREA_10481 [Glarea lozoyensis ATCC 20868]
MTSFNENANKAFFDMGYTKLCSQHRESLMIHQETECASNHSPQTFAAQQKHYRICIATQQQGNTEYKKDKTHPHTTLIEATTDRHDMANISAIDMPYVPKLVLDNYHTPTSTTKPPPAIPEKSHAQPTPQTTIMKSSHPQIDKHFQQGKRLKRRSYCSRDIPRILEDQASTPLATRLSASSLNTLNALTHTRSRSECRELLGRWSKVLDEAFFFGSLMNRIADVQYTGVESGQYGHYEHSGTGLCINLDAAAPRIYKGTHEQHLICTLAHEMLHAFLDVYRCRCLGCQGLKDPSKGGVAYDGHGPDWANSMVVVEEALQKAVDWPVYTGVWPGVSQSMRKDKWQATQFQTARWRRGDPSLLTDDAKDLRQDHPARPARNSTCHERLEVQGSSSDAVGGMIGSVGAHAVGGLSTPEPAHQRRHKRRQYSWSENGTTRSELMTQDGRREGSPSHRRVNQIEGYRIPRCGGCLDYGCAIM